MQMKEYIPSCSFMFAIDECSFIFASEGALLQIANDDCSILFLPEGEKYFAISHKKRVSIIKLCYA
jgi:hypothetical protein